ncbi:MAG: membrane dipeptidase [Chitinophagaceae bacterium]|nr:membrane dipeptidase [Chitinophagaceae bacterium]
MKKIFLLLIPFNAYLSYSQNYQKLHQKAIVVDTHNDVLSTVVMKGMNIENDLTGKSHSDIARFKKGGVDVQIFSVFGDERFGKNTAFKYANIEIDSLYEIVERNRDKMMMVTNSSQLKQAVRQHKTGCMIGVEGGHMIEDSLKYLDRLYQRGTRYMTLTWNNSTSWATSAADESKNSMPFGSKGLTAFGKQIVKRMNELGMIIDVSHVGEQTFRDAINTTTKPVIASHSSVYTLCPVPRNLKDEQIKAISKNGGVIHINFYSGFLDSNYNKRKDAFLLKHKQQVDSLMKINWATYEIQQWISGQFPAEANALRPPISVLLDHLDYIVKLTGVDHIGLGSDFDGIESVPQGLDDITYFPLITKALYERGYSKRNIKKILGGNFIRVLKANEQK